MRYFNLFIALILLNTSQAQSPLSISLEKAQEIGLENHLSLKNASLDEKYAQQRVYEIRSMGLPQVGASANFTHNLVIATQMLPDFITPSVYGVLFQEQLLTPRNIDIATLPAQFGVPYTLFAGLNVNQLLFDGTYFLGLKAANEYKNVSSLMTKQQEIEVKESVAKAFLMVFFTQNQWGQLKESLSQVEKLKTETEQLVKTGFGEQLDIDRLELTVMNLQTQINNLGKTLELSKQALLFQMGLDIDQEIILEGELESYLPENLDLANSLNLNTRIETKILDQQIRLNEMDVKRNQYGYVPTLYGNFNYGGNSFAGENEFDKLGDEWFGLSAYGITLSVPIFDGFYKRSKIQQAKIDLEKSVNQKTLITQSFDLEYKSARMEWDNAVSNLKFQEKNKKLAERIYQTTQKKYTNGMASSFELITTENERIQAYSNYIQALYDLNVALLKIKKSTGNL